jgi:oligogalacturonide transport system substrate-binding protein
MVRGKSISGILLATVLCMSIVGNPKMESASAAAKGKAQAKPITLRFCWWGSDVRHKATLAAFDAYMAKHPNIKLEGEYSTIDTYYQKIVTQLVGSAAPDIITLDYPWLTDLKKQGDFFEDLNKHKDIFDFSKFDMKYVKGYCSVGGKLAAIPFAQNGYSIIFNKKLVDPAGIDLNENSKWDWDTLIEEGKKFKKSNPNKVFLHSDLQTLEYNILRPYVQQLSGKQWVTADFKIGATKKQLVSGYQYLNKLMDLKLIQPLSETAAYDGKIDQNPVWAEGRAAMVIRWSSDLISLINPNVEIEVARLPIFKGAKETAINCKPSMVGAVNKKSANKKEAIKFLYWMLTSNDALDVLKDSRGVPANATARNYLIKKNLLNKQLVESIEIASANAGTPVNGISGNMELTSISKDVLAKVLFNRSTPEQAADELVRLFNDKLNTLKK